MQNTTTNNTTKSVEKNKTSSFLGWIKGFFYLLTGECIEELFEGLIEAGVVDGIAWIFSNAITNVIFVFGAVQASKILIKKIIMIIIKPIIKKITYKEGNDKMKIFVNLLQKFSDNLATNPITFGGITFDGAIVGALAYLISNVLMPILPLWAVVLITLIICVLVFTVIIYFVSKVYDKPVCKEERLKLKEEKKILLDAKKQDAKLTKEAKLQAKKEAEEQQKAMHDQLVLQKMNELKAKEQEQQQ